jgi:hypothetical protein
VPPSDRRENPRFACDLDVTIELQETGAIEARAVDMSFSGICVTADAHIKPRTPVKFLVRLVANGAHSDELPLAGTIVWCTALGDAYQIGGRFDPTMPDETWSKLDVLIRFLVGELAMTPDDRGS